VREHNTLYITPFVFPPQGENFFIIYNILKIPSPPGRGIKGEGYFPLPLGEGSLITPHV